MTCNWCSLKAASNTDLTDEQAQAIVDESIENSLFTFGEWKEFIAELMLDHVKAGSGRLHWQTAIGRKNPAHRQVLETDVVAL